MGFPIKLTVALFIGFVLILLFIGLISSLLSLAPSKRIDESLLIKSTHKFNTYTIEFNRLDNNRIINYNFSLYEF